MKITVVSIFFPPDTGAPAPRLLNMSKALKNNGADIDVITALPNYPTGRIFDGYRGKVFVKEEVDGILAKRYWLYPSNSKSKVVRVFSMLSFSFSLCFAFFGLRRRKPDVVIVNSPPLLVGLSGVLIGRLAGAKVVTNIADIWPLTALELGAMRKGLFYSFFKWIEKIMYKYSNYFLTQSGETQAYLEKKTAKPVFLYRNLTPGSDYIMQTPDYDRKQLKVIYAGLLGFAQGVAQLCKAIDFKALDIEFHIYGNGMQREEIEEYIQSNDTNIFYHGEVSRNEVPKILSDFHATVIPLTHHIYGAFPSKISMAISSGLPIFFSGEGEGRKFVVENKIGWACGASDYEALYKNLEYFSKLNEQEYNEIRNNCINLSQHDFNFDVQQEKLNHFLQQITGVSEEINSDV